MRIVVAPDSFKGSIAAADASAAIAEGWLSVRAGDELVLRPMADGGEGTLDALAAAVPGARRMPVTVQGPDNRPAEAAWLRLPDGTGVVELASTSGIELLDALTPLDAHTLGFGEAIVAALDGGAERLLLAIGSSASTDGGAGVLAALGARLTDASGRPIRLGARGIGAVARVDLSAVRAVPPRGAVVLSDVTNPLLGPSGAAAVFGPQKGATPEMVETLDRALARWARALERAGATVDPSTPGAGAAGGTGFGLLAWGASVAAGAEAIAETIGLADAAAHADLVITGEGRFDGSSSAGKVPGSVLRAARDAGASAALIAGTIAAPADGFDGSVSLVALAGSAEAAMAEPARWLRAAGARLAGEGLSR